MLHMHICAAYAAEGTASCAAEGTATSTFPDGAIHSQKPITMNYHTKLTLCTSIIHPLSCTRGGI